MTDIEKYTHQFVRGSVGHHIVIEWKIKHWKFFIIRGKQGGEMKDEEMHNNDIFHSHCISSSVGRYFINSEINTEFLICKFFWGNQF